MNVGAELLSGYKVLHHAYDISVLKSYRHRYWLLTAVYFMLSESGNVVWALIIPHAAITSCSLWVTECLVISRSFFFLPLFSSLSSSLSLSLLSAGCIHLGRVQFLSQVYGATSVRDYACGAADTYTSCRFSLTSVQKRRLFAIEYPCSGHHSGRGIAP